MRGAGSPRAKKRQRLRVRPVLDLRNFVPYQLTFLASSVSRALGATMYSKFGLTSAQWRIMAILGTFAPLSTYEIASRTSLEKSLVSRTISQLTARGLVARSVNPTDKRLLMLRFSSKGRQLFDRMAAAGLAYEGFVLDRIPKNEAASLARLLLSLHQASLEYEASIAARQSARLLPRARRRLLS